MGHSIKSNPIHGWIYSICTGLNVLSHSQTTFLSCRVTDSAGHVRPSWFCRGWLVRQVETCWATTARSRTQHLSPFFFSGAGTNLKVGGHKSVPLHFLTLQLQLVVLVRAFVMVTTVWSGSCLLFFYSWCPRAQPFVKVGGTCPPCPME